MSKPSSVAIDRRALLARVNRRLAQRGEKLFKTRGEIATAEVGTYFIADLEKTTLKAVRVELEPCARELGALAGLERLAV